MIICAEDRIKPHCQDILKNVIYKLILDEEAEIAQRAYKIAELLGLYVQTDFLLPMMISHLTDSESRNVPRFVSSGLTAFSAVIHHSTQKYPDQLGSFMSKLIELIVSSDFLNNDNPEVLERVLLVTQNLVDAAGSSCKTYQHGLFKILLQLGSIPQMQAHVKRVDDTINKLASSCGIESSSDLFSIELSALLEEMKEDYENWDRNTADRFIFDMLVRRSFTAVVDYWETILMIIAANMEQDKDFELRMDMLALTEHFLLQKELHSTIVFYSEIILKMILLPSLQWKIGKPNVRIRKAAIVCIIKLMEQGLIEEEKMYASLKPLFNYLKNCLDDDWTNDIRYASVVLVRNLIEYMHGSFDKDDFDMVYPELLKRLDDAQDGIRIETCKVFTVFFTYLPNPWSSSLYEYTVKNIFIHLDDNNEDIQKAIMEVLKKAATIQTKDFIFQADDFSRKSSHPALCQNLLEYAKSL